jgi:hypothetical protein
MMMQWLSFADPELPEGTQFLGVIIVHAPTFMEAWAWTHAAGINPGGGVQGVEFDDAAPVPPEYVGRLLSKADVETLDGIMAKALN